MTARARTVMPMVSAASGLLLFASLLVAGRPARAQDGSLLVADFDGDKVQTKAGLMLMTIADEQFGGTSEAQLSLIRPGANGSRGALHVAFHVTNEFAAPFAGAWALIGPQGRAIDLSSYRGVRFHARGKDGGSFTAGIVRYAQQTLRYLAPFDVKTEWTLVDLPFTTFRQELPPNAPTATPAPFVPTDVTTIGFMAPPSRRGAFDLDIDQLELYR